MTINYIKNNSYILIYKCITLLSNLVLNGSQSSICSSLNYICKLYNLNKHVCFKSVCPLVSESDPSNDLTSTAAAIRDFIYFRNTVPLTASDADFIVNYLCTTLIAYVEPFDFVV